MNKEWSFGDFTGMVLLGYPPESFVGRIVGSCFAHETPNTEVFPPETVCEFERCNLDNVKLPPGCVVLGDCSKRRCCAQADGEDWLVDVAGKPLDHVHAAFYRDKATRLRAAGRPTDAAKMDAKLAELDVKARAAGLPAVVAVDEVIR